MSRQPERMVKVTGKVLSGIRRARHCVQGVIHRVYALPVIRHLRCLRRLRPIGNGRCNGTPVVRHYWTRYLEHHRKDIHGRCLEIGETETILRYGGTAVTQADAIDITARGPQVTVVADLSRADHLPADTYDCFVNQFTMHVIYDVQAALYHSIRILKPGGVLLVNFSSVDYYFHKGLDMGTATPMFMFWCFTPIQVENLLRRVGLSTEDFRLTVYGNLFARVAYQMNMPAEQLTRRELESSDPGYPVLICVRVVKPAKWWTARPEYQYSWIPQGTPARWNKRCGHYAK